MKISKNSTMPGHDHEESPEERDWNNREAWLEEESYAPEKVLRDNIRDAMHERGLTFAALADMANINKDSINRLLNKGAMPSGTVLSRLALALSVPVWALWMTEEQQALYVAGANGPANNDELDLLAAFRESDADGQRAILRMALMEARQSKKVSASPESEGGQPASE